MNKRHTLALAGLTLLGFVTGSAAASAFTITNGAKDSSLTICVESAPDGYAGSTVSVANARLRLQDAIANWHAAPGQNDSQALSLTYALSCSGVNFKLQAATLPAGRHAETSVSGGTIKFQDSDPWWDGTGTRQSFEWSYEGILTHELGHAFGLGHSGNAAWTYDSSTQYPTMAQCGSQSVAVTFESLQQDDWGGASWAEPTSTPFFNANAGFEKDFTHWYRSNTSQITASSSYAYTGSRGSRFAVDGNYIYMTSVYDPWYLTGITSEPVTGMDASSPTIRTSAMYRHTTSGTTGGVELSYQRAYVDYNHQHSSGCKVDAYITTYTFSSRTAFSQCGDPGTTWTSCVRDVTIAVGQGTTDAFAFRSYFESTSSSYVYVDKAGIIDNS